MKLKIGLIALAALVLAGCSSQSSSVPSVLAAGAEVQEYGLPYTMAKMTAACAQPSSDVIAAMACAKLKDFAAFCAANLPQQVATISAVNTAVATGVTTAAGIAGTVGTLAGQPAAAPAAAGVAAANQAAVTALNAGGTAVTPALVAAQVAMCQSGGFPMASAAPAPAASPVAASH